MHTPASLLPFILLTEKLKNTNRVTTVVGTNRRENSAEHSWQISLLAIVFADFSNEKIDLLKVLKMLLIHDLPEALCGDIPLYATDRSAAVAEETKAAVAVFSMLPENHSEELHSLWKEFNERKSAEAKFCAAMDRLVPFVQNMNTEGGSWIEFNVDRTKVIEKSQHAKDGSEAIWSYLLELIDEGVNRGYIRA